MVLMLLAYVVLVDVVPVELVEQDVEADDLERRDEIALAGAGFPVELGLAQFSGRACCGFAIGSSEYGCRVS